MEAGGGFQQVIDNGGSVQEADRAANKIFWLDMRLAGLDITEYAAALSPIKMGGGFWRTSLSGVTRFGAGMGSQYLEEANQEINVRLALGEEVNWDDPEVQKKFHGPIHLAFLLLLVIRRRGPVIHEFICIRRLDLCCSLVSYSGCYTR